MLSKLFELIKPDSKNVKLPPRIHPHKKEFVSQMENLILHNVLVCGLMQLAVLGCTTESLLLLFKELSIILI